VICLRRGENAVGQKGQGAMRTARLWGPHFLDLPITGGRTMAKKKKKKKEKK
jgi:hypothetical protein